ncbi:hypothetical protein H2201_005361 [Coniosporium apollinis]|uniref:Uncharacterized protein n=1 Tax=Coniosporium apollinis TaxID=61459 RepID=A0ABQ9NR11_9PEZI|nr:hypothetical protein H2201_005361 [Coniosporium apollinis]
MSPSQHLWAATFITLALFSTVNAQSRTKVTNQTSHYSEFDLFKNSGWSPCAINTTYASGRKWTHDDFVKDLWTDNQTRYCDHMKGIPIMIPTIPTQAAFLPWWPTYLAQFVSLCFTFVGLWWTARDLRKHQDRHDMTLPITFWVQLPIDIVRVIAWFWKTVHGFADPRRFAWVSVVLWLVPFDYIWLIQLFGKDRANSLAHDGELMTPINLDSKPTGSTTVQEEAACAQQPLMIQPEVCGAAEKSLRQRKPMIFWTTIIATVVTLLQWCLSLASIIIHWQYSWTSPRTQTYVEDPRAVSDPTTIGQMPVACLDWLKSGGVQNSGLIDLQVDQSIACITFTAQFVICTPAALAAILVLIRLRRGVLDGYTYKMIHFSACVCLASLVCPAFGTGFWALWKVVFGSSDTFLRYTNNLNVTGGCTFGFVNIDKRWGYWDVEYERPFRLAMSGLGAA